VFLFIPLSSECVGQFHPISGVRLILWSNFSQFLDIAVKLIC
jgi:hypothetical protein